MLVTVPKILREKLGEEGSEGLIELLNNASESTYSSVITLAEEKFERRLAEETGKLRSELSEKIEHGNTAMIRWMFIFWVGQIGALLGILFAFFR